MDQYKLDLNSLLLAFESNIIALYDLQSADADEDDFIDVNASIIKRKATVESIRQRILTFHEKWPNYDEDRLKLLEEMKEKASTSNSPAL